MEIREVQEPIAERKLVMGTDEVVVTIGKPQAFDDNGDYFCPYAIEHAGHRKLSYAGGMDAVQALQLAMKKIASDLDYLARSQGVSIEWLADTPGDSGFQA